MPDGSSLPRFFVSAGVIDSGRVELDGEVAHRLVRVLRSKPGDRILLLDDTGSEYLVELAACQPDDVKGAVIEMRPGDGEPRVAITLYQAMLKSDKFEMVLQKGTELGVAAFAPMYSARSIARSRKGDRHTARHERWSRIIREAAEQSRRGRIPALSQPAPFTDACDLPDGLSLIAWEQEREIGLRHALRSHTLAYDAGVPSVSVYVGPEGGFTVEEIEHARSRGIEPVGLGARILRAETAGLALVSAILFEMGELGG